MTQPLTTNTFIAKAQQLHGDKYDYSRTVYVRSQLAVTIVCRVHGPFEVTPNNHVSKRNMCGCPRCGKTGRYSFEEFCTVAQQRHGHYVYQRADFVNTNTPMRMTCPTHGDFFQTPTRHMQGRGCQQCGGTARIPTAELLQRAATVHQQQYGYSEVPLDASARTFVPIQCPRHGVFLQQLKLHVSRKYGCPQCGGRTSRGEQEVAAFVQSLGYPVVSGARKVIPPFELDVYVAEKRIGVEFHGLYWHTTERVGTLHVDKLRAAQSAGIRLVQVFEDEWRDRQAIVKSRLRAIFGVGERLHARKCVVRTCAPDIARAFLAAHHLQGAGRAALYLGLYTGDTLVAVASFGAARKWGSATPASGDWEIMRYAATARIRGGFTKLFSAFIKQRAPQRVISYCDLRYGDGGVYAAAGFALVGITPPDYWWVPPATRVRVPRYAVQTAKLSTNVYTAKTYMRGMTEVEACTTAGMRKIHGTGHQKWVWTASPGCVITAVSGDSVQQTAPADDIPIAAPHCM